MEDKYLTRHGGLLIDGGQQRLREIDINIVGAGALGSWLVPALVKMGCENVTIYDKDIVDDSNVSNQNYGIPDIGSTKLESLSIVCKRIDPNNQYKFVESFVEKDTELNGEIIVMAVDSIPARELITQKAITSKTCKALLDVRLGRSYMNFFALNPKSNDEMEYYSKEFLYKQGEGGDIPCTEKTFMSPVLLATSLYSGAIRAYINGKFNSVPFNVNCDTNNLFFERLARNLISELVLE